MANDVVASGKHAGRYWCELPLSYVKWAAVNGEELSGRARKELQFRETIERKLKENKKWRHGHDKSEPARQAIGRRRKQKKASNRLSKVSGKR